MERQILGDVVNHACRKGKLKFLCCATLLLVSTSYSRPAIVFPIVLGEHLRGDADADASDTSHVFALRPAQPDPVDQPLPCWQLPLANRPPRWAEMGLLHFLAKVWQGDSIVSQAETHFLQFYNP